MTKVFLPFTLLALCSTGWIFPTRAAQIATPPITPATATKGESLELTGEQAKAIVWNCEIFARDAPKLSPGVPTDLGRYRMRLLHFAKFDKYTAIFECDGVPVPVPLMETKEGDFPGIVIDGDEMRALITVTKAIRKPNPKRNMDYDITNYNVRIKRDSDVIHVYCDEGIDGIYWPKRESTAEKPDLEGYSSTGSGQNWQFDVSRKSFKIVQTYFTGW